MDLQPNRLAAALQVSTRFIEGRSGDRIGLVCFGGQALTQCPLTSDHQTLLSYLQHIQAGQTGVDGTATYAEGLLVARGGGQAAAAVEASAATPVAWEGKLPAPVTH